MRQIINTKTKPRWSSARMTNLRHLRTQACNVGHHGRVQSREFGTGFRAHARTERAMLGRHRSPYLVSYMCSEPATKSPTRITRKAVHLLCSLPSTSAAAVLSTPPPRVSYQIACQSLILLRDARPVSGVDYILQTRCSAWPRVPSSKPFGS
jgi:hypothetical protein